MKQAGIDTDRFKAHSTRSAGTSAAKGMIPIETILSSGGWSSGNTFATFYDRPICTSRSLGERFAQVATQ